MAGPGGYRAGMTASCSPSRAGYRFPAAGIGHAVRLCLRVPPSLRLVEEMPAARGIVVSHETVRQSGRTFGREIADAMRRRAPQRGDS